MNRDPHPRGYDHHNPPAAMGEDYIERHILDLGNMGYRVLHFLESVFAQYSNKTDIVKFVYNEVFAQLVLAMDFDIDEFYLRLVGLPNFEMFRHLPEFQDPITKNNLVRLYNEVGNELVQLVYQETNPMKHRAQYFCDAVTVSYIVIVKSYAPTHTFQAPHF